MQTQFGMVTFLHLTCGNRCVLRKQKDSTTIGEYPKKISATHSYISPPPAMGGGKRPDGWQWGSETIEKNVVFSYNSFSNCFLKVFGKIGFNAKRNINQKKS